MEEKAIGLVAMYADLVQLGYRVVEPQEGKIQVPAFLLEDVKVELRRRGYIK